MLYYKIVRLRGKECAVAMGITVTVASKDEREVWRLVKADDQLQARAVLASTMTIARPHRH